MTMVMTMTVSLAMAVTTTTNITSAVGDRVGPRPGAIPVNARAQALAARETPRELVRLHGPATERFLQVGAAATDGTRQEATPATPRPLLANPLCAADDT